MKWMWKDRKIKEVRKCRYLGYVMRANGGQERQVEDRVRKAAAVMGGKCGQ